VALSPAPIETLADLLDRLGGVPPARVRFRPYPGTATEADVLAVMQGPDKRLCELVEGVLVEKAMGYRESGLTVFLATVLNAFVRPRNLGLVAGEAGAMRLFGGLIRIPDVSFTSWDRIPDSRAGPGCRGIESQQHAGRDGSQEAGLFHRRGPARLGDRSSRPHRERLHWRGAGQGAIDQRHAGRRGRTARFRSAAPGPFRRA